MKDRKGIFRSRLNSRVFVFRCYVAYLFHDSTGEVIFPPLFFQQNVGKAPPLYVD